MTSTTTNSLASGGVGVVVGALLGVLAFVPSPLPDGDIEITYDSKAVWLEDGTKIYQVRIQHADGGIDAAYRPASNPPCKRRPEGLDAGLCMRVIVDSNGVTVSDEAPELNRYPSEQMIGPGCEGVACSIWSGQSSDGPEEPPP